MLSSFVNRFLSTFSHGSFIFIIGSVRLLSSWSQSFKKLASSGFNWATRHSLSPAPP